jgi:hypothetical protein
MAFGIKRSFLNIAGKGIHAAAGAEAGKEGFEPFLSVAKDLKNGRTQIFGGLSAEWERPDDADEGLERSVGTTVGVMGTWRRFRYISEFSWSRGPERSRTEICPGVIVPLSGKYKLGFGIPLRLTRALPDPQHEPSSQFQRAGFIVYVVHEMRLWHK